MSLLLVLIGVIGQWLLGIGCSELLLRRADADDGGRSRFIGAEQVGLGLVLGVAVTSGLSFLYSLLGGDIGFGWSLTVAGVGWVCGGLVFARGWLSRTGDQPTTGDAKHAQVEFVRVCRYSILILFVLALVQTLLTPQRFWDERATFAIKAAVLDEDGTVYSGDLADADFVQYHPQYPLLIPLAEQHIYALLGEVNDRWPKVLFPLLYLGMVLTFAGVLQRHTSQARAWLFSVLLATVPVLMPWEYGFLCAQADAPVACFHGVSLLYLWDALRNRGARPRMHRSLLIAGVTAAAAAFTKDEGLALMMVDVLALLIALSISRLYGFGTPGRVVDSGDETRSGSIRQSVVIVVVFVSAAAICLAPWLWYRGSLPSTTEMNYFGRATPERLREQLGTLSWSVPHIVRRMLFDIQSWGLLSGWGLQWWLMVAALVTFPKRALRTEQLVLMLDVLGAVAALLIAGMLSPTEISEHIGNSSHRFLMQLAPAAVLFAAGQWSGERPSKE